MQTCRIDLPLRQARPLKRTICKPTTIPNTTNQARTMAFIQRNLYPTPEASLTPLFRLFDDFDSYARHGGSRRPAVPQWQPKFDVREVADAYELHGELPGVTKDNVHIEFTEPQTMLVRGKTERSYTAGTSPNGPAVEDVAMSGAATPEQEPEEQPKGSPRQATVEDELDSESRESGFEEVIQTKKTEKPVETPKKATDKAKYWLTERSIGEFTRSFNFPSRVDQDGVSASFEHGILSVRVPKAKKHESRRININ